MRARVRCDRADVCKHRPRLSLSPLQSGCWSRFVEETANAASSDSTTGPLCVRAGVSRNTGEHASRNGGAYASAHRARAGKTTAFAIDFSSEPSLFDALAAVESSPAFHGRERLNKETASRSDG